MCKENFHPLAVGSSARRHASAHLALFVLMVLLLCTAGSAIAQKTLNPPTETHRWVSLGDPGVAYDEICEEDNSGQVICWESCPNSPDNICAELVDPAGNVDRTCCIPALFEGTDDPDACLINVTLVRHDPQE